MRKFAWLTLVAAAALFFSAQDGAFAHAAHHHVQQTQSASAPVESAVSASGQESHVEVFVSAVSRDTGECPYKHKQSDCGSCCACTGGSSVALATPEAITGRLSARSERTVPIVPHERRHATLDLNRPPKSFA